MVSWTQRSTQSNTCKKSPRSPCFHYFLNNESSTLVKHGLLKNLPCLLRQTTKIFFISTTGVWLMKYSLDSTLYFFSNYFASKLINSTLMISAYNVNRWNLHYGNVYHRWTNSGRSAEICKIRSMGLYIVEWPNVALKSDIWEQTSGLTSLALFCLSLLNQYHHLMKRVLILHWY